MTKPSDITLSCRWVPWAFVGFFVCLAIVLGSMATVAVSGYPGVVTDRAYEKGLAYNHTLEAEARQDALGWQGALTMTEQAGGATQFFLTLHDAQGNPIEGVAHLWLMRPTGNGMDQDAPLRTQGNGKYAATFHGLAKGLWRAHVTVRRDQDVWQTEQRVMVEP